MRDTRTRAIRFRAIWGTGPALLCLLALALLPHSCRAQTPAPPAFNPALVTFKAIIAPATIKPGGSVVWTGTLVNANAPSQQVPDLLISTDALLNYTDPTGATQVIDSGPVTVDEPAYTNDEKAHGGIVTLTVPTLLQLVPGKSDPCTVGPTTGGNYTITVPYGDVDGGQTVAHSLTFSLVSVKVGDLPRQRQTLRLAVRVNYDPLLPDLPPLDPVPPILR